MTPYNEHVRLAQALRHGHLYIDPAPSWMEHITVNGHDYILHPPLSAFLCVPFVAVGITDQRLICCVLGAVSALLCYRLTRSAWLTAFFVCGTTFLYELSNGASWDFALVASTPFTFAALIAKKPVWIGLFAGLAALARYDLFLAWPVYGYLLWRNNRSRDTWIALVPVAGAVLFYIWFAEARFGTLTDGSVSEWYWHYDTFRMQRPYGPFSLHYLPFNLYTLLFMAPAYQGGFPWIRPQFMGQALLSLSPALLMVRPSPYFLAALACAIPALTVYASGFSQLGCRYYVQVFPFLIAAMSGNGSGSPLALKNKALIAASIFLSMSFTAIVWEYGLAGT